jgi:hypothetical protein
VTGTGRSADRPVFDALMYSDVRISRFLIASVGLVVTQLQHVLHAQYTDMSQSSTQPVERLTSEVFTIDSLHNMPLSCAFLSSVR